MKEHPQIIEQTAKRYKAAQAIGVLLLMVGTVAFVSGIAAEKSFHGGFMMFLGFGAYVGGRFLAWWNHG